MVRWRRSPALLSVAAFCQSFSLWADEPIREMSFPQFLTSDTTYTQKSEAQAAHQKLWQHYLVRAHHDALRQEQHKQRSLSYGDKRMRFSLEVRGGRPDTGYPVYIALHGGGDAPAHVNESQWLDMQSYYRDSVESGIYIAPRGITDTWNLHFVDESFPLYDRLIENLVTYEGADPNRIYLLGFSAGGDGVYQVVPRMANRFAAANMSAGHHNGIGFDNLFNLPFLMQVGEYDSAYNRNKVAAQNFLAISALQAKAQGGYIHQLFIHPGYGHNGWPDHNAGGQAHPVIKDPKAWLEAGDRTTTSVDTDAVHWLRQHVRTPRPERLIWDLGGRANRPASWGSVYAEGAQSLSAQNNLFHWLALDEAPAAGARIEARLLRGSNAVQIDQASGVTKFRVLLHGDDFDFTAPLKVYYRGQVIAEKAPAYRLQIMARTLLEHSDPSMVFDDEITVTLPTAAMVRESDSQKFTYCSNGNCYLKSAEEFQRSKRYPRELNYRCVRDMDYALTFDDGPTGRMPKVLAKLAEHQVPATFFVVGRHIASEEAKANLRDAFAQGHQIANHTYSHRDLMDLSREQIIDEVTSTQQTIIAALGDTPRVRLDSSIVRPPYGTIDQRVQDVLSSLHFSSVRWNSDRYDWNLREDQGEVVQQRVEQHLAFLEQLSSMSSLQHSILDLNHEGSGATLSVLGKVIPLLKSRGYRLVTVSECLGKF